MQFLHCRCEEVAVDFCWKQSVIHDSLKSHARYISRIEQLFVYTKQLEKNA